MLKIDMTFSLGPTNQSVNLSLANSQRTKWWNPVTTLVKAGVTYEIAIWYVTLGAKFEFTTSLSAT